ncbi:hypothetical protein EV182_000370 [Spiromyces aspiralis]|uniref:Uncharacterized protein n=1 Tax=Spiromyces aspiralis TaxID=68401 RepID=A0ACC1HV95_9FUNG|nr:hypothetical protein EV182_000370 [Spiromyces aspiralis]
MKSSHVLKLAPCLSTGTATTSTAASVSTWAKYRVRKRRIATSARLNPQGIAPSTLYTSDVSLPMSSPLPKINHAVSFPWLLSVERPRSPLSPLEMSELAVSRHIPQPVLKSLSDRLTSSLVTRLLTPKTLDSIATGARQAVVTVTDALSSPEPSRELPRFCTMPLWSRYISEFETLEKDGVDLCLRITDVHNVDIDQFYLRFGDECAFYQDDYPLSASNILSQRQVDEFERSAQHSRQRYSLQRWLGVTLGVSRNSGFPSPSILPVFANNTDFPFRCRVDVRVNASIEYRLNQTVESSCNPRTLINDKASRTIILTFETPHFSGREEAHTSNWRWMLADIDRLLESEQQRRKDRALLEQSRHV